MTRSNKPSIGAIRWDYLNGRDKITNCELKSLSPKEFHDKVPFFLTNEDETTVSGNENNQEAIDKQILYAQNGGIDYWAFISGTETDPDAPECYALEKYITSKLRTSLKFCLILHKHDKNTWEDRVNRLIAQMKDTGYFTVLESRPVVYVYSVEDMEKEYGAGSGTLQAFGLIRQKAAGAGLPNPYIVAMCSCVRILSDSKYADKYQLDAISAYSFVGDRKDMASEPPFENLAVQNWDLWNVYLSSQKKYIPLVSFGRNEKPRLNNPPPWGGGHGPYWNNPTGQEVARQLKAGMDFVRNHPDSCEANAVLCYAWNEYTEGGWICPTWSEGTGKLDAIRAMLEEYK